MKRTVAVMLFSILALAGICGSRQPRRAKVVLLSAAEWHSAQSQVNTNGYCYLEKHIVIIAITNRCSFVMNVALPEISSEPDELEDIKPNAVEPLPYANQVM